MKRFAFVTALALMAVALVGTPLRAHESADGVKEKGLTGSWLVKVQGDISFLSLVTVNDDGTWQWILPTLALDGASPDSRVTCTGPWHRTGARRFHLTLYCLASQEPNASAGSGRYMFDVTLSKDGLTFKDPAFRWEWFASGLPDDTPDYFGDLSVEGTRLPDRPKP